MITVLSFRMKPNGKRGPPGRIDLTTELHLARYPLKKVSAIKDIFLEQRVSSLLVVRENDGVVIFQLCNVLKTLTNFDCVTGPDGSG